MKKWRKKEKKKKKMKKMKEKKEEKMNNPYTWNNSWLPTMKLAPVLIHLSEREK